MIEKRDTWIPQIISEFQGHFWDWRQNQNCFCGLLGPHFATIAKFQWFSKAPSPLNGMVWDNHWVQWFFNGFGVRQPLVSMVYDGCPPLVQRWNGYIPSLKSKQHTKYELIEYHGCNHLLRFVLKFAGGSVQFCAGSVCSFIFYRNWQYLQTSQSALQSSWSGSNSRQTER